MSMKRHGAAISVLVISLTIMGCVSPGEPRQATGNIPRIVQLYISSRQDLRAPDRPSRTLLRLGNIELLIKKAIELQDPEEKEAAIIHIGRLMKGFQSTWNRENIDDFTIIKDMGILSKKQLTIDLEKVKEHNLFESFVKERKNRPNNNSNNSNKNRRNNGGRRRRN